MTLLTKQIISKFEKHPIHSQDGKGMDAEVLVKYFNPCGSGTWLITEAEREGDDWRLFGYCHIHEWEWGYLMLSELASLRLPFGLTIERDIHSTGKYVRDFLARGTIRTTVLLLQIRRYNDMGTTEEKIQRLEEELDKALADECCKNLSFVAVGSMTSEGRNFLQRYIEKIQRLQQEYDRRRWLKRIADGEVFTLDDIGKCRPEIMREYPEYELPITAHSGILLAAEAIRKSFGRKYYLPLYKYPIKVDFGTRMDGYASCIPVISFNTKTRTGRRNNLPPVHHRRALT